MRYSRVCFRNRSDSVTGTVDVLQHSISVFCQRGYPVGFVGHRISHYSQFGYFRTRSASFCVGASSPIGASGKWISSIRKLFHSPLRLHIFQVKLYSEGMFHHGVQHGANLFSMILEKPSCRLRKVSMVEWIVPLQIIPLRWSSGSVSGSGSSFHLKEPYCQ